MSTELHAALASYVASIDAVPRRLERNWAEIERRVGVDAELEPATEAEIDASPRSTPASTSSTRLSFAAVALAAAALVIASLAHLAVSSVREDIRAEATMAPYASDDDKPLVELPREVQPGEPRTRSANVVDAPTPAFTPAPAPAPAVRAPASGGSTPIAPRRKRPAKPAQSEPVQPPSSVSSLSAEVALLGRARAALRDGDPRQALVHATEHARRHPDGELREEARALRVVALCGAGEVDAAERERAAFLRDHAGSPLAATVRASCAGSGDSAP